MIRLTTLIQVRGCYLRSVTLLARTIQAWALQRFESGRLISWLGGVAGAFLIATFSIVLGFQFHVGIYRIAVSNIAHEGRESYSDFRPVAIGFKKLRYQCTPLK